MLAYLAVLFVALTPGVLFTFPGSSKLIVAAVHGLVFALVWHFTHKFVSRAVEGFQTPEVSPPPAMPAMPAMTAPAMPSMTAPAMPTMTAPAMSDAQMGNRLSMTCSTLKQAIAAIQCV